MGYANMIRKAKVTDVKKIQKLINYHARRDRMLPRSLNELYENIRDFFVYVDGAKIYGCCALHIDWEDLSEIKSLAVLPAKSGRGIGKKLLEECIKEARALKIKKVFALTYIPGSQPLAKVVKQPFLSWIKTIISYTLG